MHLIAYKFSLRRLDIVYLCVCVCVYAYCYRCLLKLAKWPQISSRSDTEIASSLLMFWFSYPFCAINVFIYNGTTALKKIYFWKPICTELPDFQSVHLYWTTRITFLFQLFTYYFIIIIIISICQYLPHLIKRFYVAQAFYFALNTSETFISSAHVEKVKPTSNLRLWNWKESVKSYGWPLPSGR